ncbi:hypothetical protein HK105_205258 [Polyrhizophydium stewartii]|uniref:Extracellular membrane protein CFEM domain-containing protein n=1 Tax=Polyrhizophydium stewartii TaxID=2732419 RepID=A0ABR4N6K5_9FUNG
MLAAAIAIAAAAGAAAAQAAATAPPAACSAACSPVVSGMAKCKTDANPASSAEWSTVAATLSKCICPVLQAAAGDQCLLCIQQSDFGSPATKLFTLIKQGCFNGDQTRTTADIAAVWGVTLAGGSDTGSGSSPSQPPSSQSPSSLGATSVPSPKSASGASSVAASIFGVLAAAVPLMFV